MPSRQFYFIGCLLFILLLAGSPRAAGLDAEAPAGPDAGDAALAQIWSARLDDAAELDSQADDFTRQADSLSASLAAELQEVNARFARHNSLYQASRGHPTEQVTLVQQMHSLCDRLAGRIAPLDALSASLGDRVREIGLLQENLKDLSGDQGLGAESLRAYGQSLDRARQRLDALSLRLEKTLAPARDSVARMNQTVAEIEKSLTGIWEDHYLTPSENSLDALASTPALLSAWVASLDARLGFAYPQSAADWLQAARNFAITAFITVLIGFAGFRLSRRIHGRWQSALDGVIRRSLPWLGLGWAVLMASGNRNGGLYMALVLLGSLIIIAGFAALSWRLRQAVAPALEKAASPLASFYPPAALGVLMLFSDLPIRVLGVVWSVIMLAFVALVIARNRRRKSGDKLPLLERFSYNCAVYFGIASLLVALSGYARLAILVFMLLFALVNLLTLGNALGGLMNLLASIFFSRGKNPLGNAVAKAAAIPLAWLLSLLSALPWIWAVPGARYLLDHLLQADYKIGVASVDFSKILLIIFLFFLFRSLIGLGVATLNRLPERIPHLEHGVIPPLRGVLTYLVWGLFILVVLGLLGVNFTSLAVVAGGLSVGLGLSLQSIFSNFVSGLFLIFGRTLLVGDYIEVGGIAGTVKAVKIRATVVETSARALVYVPNSSIMSGQLTNWTRDSRLARGSVQVGVAYGSDTAQVKNLLLQAAKGHPHVLDEPAAFVIFADFGDSALDFTLYFYLDDFNNTLSAASDIRFAIERSFAEHGVDIPFPQMTLHMNPADPAATD
ncbi:MAG: mechanosensitive ion channel [Deltaproteobacteria bacterium]|jgi:small-conductance mechanosensitive channel|nr:mechanosensitive ion channel [Deltaproteobacteria bacterium]